MCEHGVNLGQLRLSIGQSDDALAMVQQWLEQLHHLADRCESPAMSAHVAQANVLLGEARGRLEQAIQDLEGESGRGGVSVELV